MHLVKELTRAWRDFSLLTKFFTLLGGPALMFCIGLSLTFKGEAAERSLRDQLDYTRAQRELLTALQGHLATMESVGRGYLIVAIPASLNRFDEAGKQAVNDAAMVLHRAGDYPAAAVKQLPQLVAEKVAACRALLQAAAVEPARVKAAFLQSESAMQVVKDDLAAIDLEAKAVEEAGRRRLDRSVRYESLVGGGVIGIGTLGAVISTLVFLRSLRRRMMKLQQQARALKMEAPLLDERASADELGQLQAEMGRSSEILASRVGDLRSQEMQLRSFMDQSGAIVYLKDLESRFLMVNHGYELAFGLSAEQAIGRNPEELFGETLGRQLRRNDLEVIQSLQPAEFEEKISIGGKEISYVSVKAPLLGPDGVPYGVCGISIRPPLVAAPEQREEVGMTPEERVSESPELTRPRPQLRNTVAIDLDHVLANITRHSRQFIEHVSPDDRFFSPAREILQASERAAALAMQLRAMTPIPILESQDPALPGGNETLLLAEDEPLVAQFETRLLRSLGYHVLCAENGHEAERILAESAPIDLLITDLKMPGLNGYDLISVARLRYPDLKILVVSGDHASELAGLAVEALPKPFELQAMATSVRKLLDASLTPA